MSVKAVKSGAVDFFLKPFSASKILAAIALAIKKSKAIIKKQNKADRIRRSIKTLSPRELEVFRLVSNGMLSKQIAFKRGTVLQTIKVHCSRVMRKMRARNVTELIHFAQIAGVVPLP